MQFRDLLKNHSDVQHEAAKPDAAPGKSVVIGDRGRADRELIGAQVTALGYLPLFADTGSRVVEMAVEYLPRMVVVNLELEGIGGREVLSALREADKTRDIPVVLISDSGQTPDMVIGSQVGADDYICKPLDGPTVKGRIRELLLKDSATPPEPPPPPPQAEPASPHETGADGPATQAQAPKAPTEPEPTESAAAHIERAEQLYAECCEFASDAMDRARREEPPDIARCRDLATRLVQECESSNRLLLKAVRSYASGESPRDAANVAIFSVKIGRGLNYDAEELTALGMAAMCHEVGMSCVPEDVASTEGKYSRRQWNKIRHHPEHAFGILSKLGEEYHWLAEAVYQEHERERGQGYPRGLKGDEICEFAKVIGLADTYEALSHRRSFRKAFIAFDALREIIGMRNKYFAAHIIRALVSEVSVFPLESYVQLNTGEIGRVVKTQPDSLLRPVVVVEYDASGHRVRRPKVVDLVAKPLLYVTKPVDESELIPSG